MPDPPTPGLTPEPAVATAAQAPAAAVELTGFDLTVEQVARVARGGAPVALSRDPRVGERMEASRRYLTAAAERGEAIYGVTTGFGGMANVLIPPGEARALQHNLIRFTTAGAGRPLARGDVRAAMLLRANSHLHGVSGIRPEIVERLVVFLNQGVVPLVPELGSIGASGDLVPLAYITGAVYGLDDHYAVEHGGRTKGSRQALAELGLAPLELEAKEGLAMINGTSVMAGIAANCAFEARVLLAAALGAHAFFFQGLEASNQGLHPFIHEHKPHPGQQTAARELLRLLAGSALVRDELDGRHDPRGDQPIQDRYSLRCAPQFLGPVIDGLRAVWRDLETELNSANDNPLIDAERDGGRGCSYHAGNFLGQYVGVAMDQLRYQLALTAKHLDAQIALLVMPAMSNGLPPSLVGNPERTINMGLKALQLTGNAIVPVLCQLANPLVPHFPTHAEQFNQNVNSQGLGAATLARQSLELMRQHAAVALLFGVQAVDLRTRLRHGHCDARAVLSPALVPLYEAVRAAVERPADRARPLVWDDDQQFLDDFVAALAGDLGAAGEPAPASLLGAALADTARELVP